MSFSPKRLIQLLESGALIPIYHRTPGAIDAQGEPEGAPPPPAQRAIPDRDEPDGTTFDPDHNAAEQAEALSDAADDGVPFCEECARASLMRIDVAAIERQLWPYGSNRDVYMILDGARDRRIYSDLMNSHLIYSCLYSGEIRIRAGSGRASPGAA